MKCGCGGRKWLDCVGAGWDNPDTDTHGHTSDLARISSAPESLEGCQIDRQIEWRDDMAKHPHKLMLHNRKTWRCMLDGCTFFVHRGLESILIGRMIECWGCTEIFIADEYALKEEMPRCNVCREIKPKLHEIEEETTEPIKLEIDEAKMKIYRELGILKDKR